MIYEQIDLLLVSKRHYHYHHLIDSPIMISKADTATFYIGKAKVSIALYHDNDRVDLLKSIKSKIKITKTIREGYL